MRPSLPAFLLLASLATLGGTVSAAEDVRRVGDAAGRLAVAEIYCNGHITEQGRALFAEMRRQDWATFSQGVLEGANALARGYVLGMDACAGILARFGKQGIDYRGLWQLND